MHEDRRTDRREPVMLPVTYRVAGRSTVKRGQLLDRSRGGVLLVSREPIALGTLIEICVKPEEEYRYPRVLHAKIVWLEWLASETRSWWSAQMEYRYGCRVLPNKAVVMTPSELRSATGR